MSIGSNWASPIIRGMGHLARLVTQGFGGSTAKLDDTQIIRRTITKEYAIEIIAPVQIEKTQEYEITATVNHKKLIEVLNALDI